MGRKFKYWTIGLRLRMRYLSPKPVYSIQLMPGSKVISKQYHTCQNVHTHNIYHISKLIFLRAPKPIHTQKQMNKPEINTICSVSKKIHTQKLWTSFPRPVSWTVDVHATSQIHLHRHFRLGVVTCWAFDDERAYSLSCWDRGKCVRIEQGFDGLLSLESHPRCSLNHVGFRLLGLHQPSA